MKFIQVCLAVCLAVAVAQGVPVAQSPQGLDVDTIMRDVVKITPEMTPDEIFSRMTTFVDEFNSLIESGRSVIESIDRQVLEEQKQVIDAWVDDSLKALDGMTRDDIFDYARVRYEQAGQWAAQQLANEGLEQGNPIWEALGDDFDASFEDELKRLDAATQGLSDEELRQNIKEQVAAFKANLDVGYSWLETMTDIGVDSLVGDVEMSMILDLESRVGYTYEDWRKVFEVALDNLKPVIA